jgi:hypothetical protein
MSSREHNSKLEVFAPGLRVAANGSRHRRRESMCRGYCVSGGESLDAALEVNQRP